MARFLRSYGIYKLGKPVVVGAPAAPFVARPVDVTLAGRTRLDNQTRRGAYHFLRPPAVLDTRDPQPIQTQIYVTLVRTRPPAVHSRLRPPAVVTAAVVFTAPPVSVTLAPHARRPGRGVLRKPTALRVFSGPAVHLTRIKPPGVLTFLRGPLLDTRRPGPRQTQILTALTRIRPPAVHSKLRPPAVVGAVVEAVTYPISVTLAPSARRAGRWLLRKPTVLQVFEAARTHLIRIRPAAVRSRIEPPQVIRVPSVEQALRTIKTPFVRIEPPPVRSELRPPTVVRVPSVEQEQQTIRVHLARITPPSQRAFLRPPQALRVFSGPEVYVTRIRPPKVTSELRPPTRVTPAAEPTLAQQTITTWLVRIRPPQKAAELRPPTVVGRQATEEQRTLRVYLTQIKPPRKRVFLRPPTVVRVPSVEQRRRTIEVTLAPHARRPGKGVLRPPQRLRVFTGPDTYLARIRPAAVRSKLRAPVVLARRVLDEIRSGQIRIRPPAVRSRLRPPTRVREFIAQPVTVTLTRIRPPAVRSELRPPATLERAAVYPPISVTLVRIRPPAVMRLLRPGIVRDFIPPQGHDCGFDSTSTAVCYGAIVTDIECGTTSTPSRVSGSSSSGSRISGTVQSRNRVSGTDQEAS